ncbi:hypothetical protein [Nocardioides terrisoli]|uniref:hypothetical protein n=1 Tax=Nocardioides terrisoli TaxID=3388267 RepID=UPI00287B6D0E|nr:hypothetical protein [Nocardioides marmorisolisilvae]
MVRICVLLALVGTAFRVCGTAAALPDRRPAAPGALPDPLAVLHQWDDARAAAWLRQDESGLRRLYVPGSTAARTDVRRLREYSDRGVQVVDLHTQIFSVRVLGRSGGSLRLVIVDRAVGSGMGRQRCVALPVSPPRQRTVELHRGGGGAWLVASVSG